MKQTKLFFTCLLAIALMASLSGCGCSRRDLSPTGSKPPIVTPEIPQLPPVNAGVSVPNEPIASDQAALEALPPLPMTADFEALSSLSNKGVLWGPGTAQDADGRSTACIELQEKYGDQKACFILPKESNTVVLTFDQGYENGYTTKILDTLKEKNVKAVFFLTGHYLRSEPELIQRMIDEGHVLGSHSDSHKVYCEALTPEESLADALYMQTALRDDYDYEMRLFRYPEGKFSEQSLALLEQMGYHTLFWSFAYGDWNPKAQPDPEQAFEKIMKFAHPGEIMLLHSVSSTNAEILPRVIDALREKNLEIAVPMAEIFSQNLSE